MSVNDLAEKWRDEDGPQFVPDTRESVIERVQDAFSDCASDLEEVARTAWHPVSEPPTEADADDHGLVAWQDCYGRVETSNWWLVRDEPDLFLGCQWARTRDVILMPPQGGE